ncbi:MAG: hypothetical protein JWO82_1553 [Akkermansiaceae bacterium]|nr:hypothetical protein [Akkermansiaceae bacterium]
MIDLKTSIFMARLRVAAIPFSSLAVLGLPASADPVAERLDAIMAEPKPHDRLSQLAEWGEKLPVDEIPRALASADHFKQWREGAVLRTAALKAWSKQAPAESFAYIAKLPESRLKNDSLRVAAVQFALRNPEQAAKSAAGLPLSASGQEAIGAIAETWAGSDVAGALAWVDSLPEGPAGQSALNSILYIWVHKDPAACWKRVQTIPPGDNRSALVTNIAGDWAASDPAAAIQWADGLDDRIERALALQNAAESWANHDPAAAAEFVLKMPAGDMRLQAAAEVTAIWGTQDPEQAANWIREKLEPAVQQQAVARLMQFWGGVDPQASGQWVGALQPGPLREAAISSYADTASFWAPGQAANLALTLADPSARQQKLDLCLKRWFETDHLAMKSWLENAPLSPEAKSRWQVQLALTPK